ncbi:unnamed protein product [Tuber aestivum]|uniref:Uncharacterized protein n=1 Tax=Tuber aestivum TaxID=59557 RepID=A0A292PZA0_9PEZI|nr:unnamed protein product [Tuber aestivum]
MLARKALETARVLFLGELQMPDRDRLGGVLVGSGNRALGDVGRVAGSGGHPEFERFVEVLGQRCQVLQWTGGGLEEGAEGEIVEGWNGRWTPETLTVFSRPIPVPKVQNGTAVFFSDLLSESLGLEDIALTSTFHNLFVCAVPPLNPSLKNEAKRLISLLNAVYIRIQCPPPLAFTYPIEELFFHTPTSTASPNGETEWDISGDSAPLLSEKFSETYQYSTLPLRSNIASSYIPQAQESVQKMNFANAEAFTGTVELFPAERAERSAAMLGGKGLRSAVVPPGFGMERFWAWLGGERGRGSRVRGSRRAGGTGRKAVIDEV